MQPLIGLEHIQCLLYHLILALYPHEDTCNASMYTLKHNAL